MGELTTKELDISSPLLILLKTPGSLRMGSSSGLADHLDFDHGLKFQDDVRRCLCSPVHHPYDSLDGSFFLLVTFRRYLFHLTEDSVGLAIQSCLGGKAPNFHVKFLSTNHFSVSVFSMEVGFFIYRLRRVTTASSISIFTSGTMEPPIGRAKNVLGN